MADVRIKDIVTTATAAADDDYAVLDGSTNGTRKILASALGGGGDIDFSAPHKIGTLGTDEVWEAYIIESDYSGGGFYSKTITFSDYGITGISTVLSLEGLALYDDGWSYVMFTPNTSGSHRFENNGFNTSSINIYDPSQSDYKAILHLIYTKATS